MSTHISFEGYWIGTFRHDGPDWEDELRYQVVQFELRVEPRDREGRSTFPDGDKHLATYCEGGFGAVATECFLEGNRLVFMVPDLEKDELHEENQRGTRFSGEFDPATGGFLGEWEIGELRVEHGPDFLDNISTGSWEMRRAASR